MAKVTEGIRVNVEPELLAALDAEAAAQDRSRAAIIRLALREYLAGSGSLDKRKGSK